MQQLISLQSNRVKFASDHIHYPCDSETEAIAVLQQFEETLAYWAFRLHKAFARITAPNLQYDIPAELADEAIAMTHTTSMSDQMVQAVLHNDNEDLDDNPEMAIAALYYDVPLYEKLHELSQDRDRKIAVFRQRDQKQVALSYGIRVNIIGATRLEAVTNRTRHNFWELQRLDDYIRTEAPQIDPDRGNSIIVKWQGYSPATRENWREWECEVFAFRIGNEVYEVSETKDIHPISKPIGAAMAS